VRAAVVNVQRAMREDPPAVFLYWSQTARAVSTRFVVPPTPDRDVIKALAEWLPAGPGASAAPTVSP
jgi:hypothetical protein